MHATTPFKKHPLSLAIHACCYSMLGAVPLAQAAPVGGEVVGGSGAVTQSGAATTIHQASQNMAMNWQSFDVQANERVQFIQPNTSSIALNRVLSNNGSVIAGRIDANGHVILVNPNGVFFTPTASLNVGGFIASGLDISPADFMNGQYIFHDLPGTSGAVVNSGMITASLGGNVALLGKHVGNNGLIAATLGSVNLAAGKQAVLTFDQGGLLGVRVSEAMLQKDLGVDPAVLNSGQIQAQGGRVLLTASVSQEVFSQAVNTHGLEPATSVVVNTDGSFTLGSGADVVNRGSIDTSSGAPDQHAGRIILLGENVTSSGSLRADAVHGNGGDIELHAQNTTLLTQDSVTSARAEQGGQGGVVKVLGDRVGLFDRSKVDVSGAEGGGQALIGGDYQGKNLRIRNAEATVVGRDATVMADAIERGDGGKTILWSDGYTGFFGSIFARGGAIAGNGGLAETSGKATLSFDGQADLTASNGKIGLLLLDPTNLNIRNNNNASDLTTTNPDIAFGTNIGTVSATSITSVLRTTDIKLQATQSITVSDVILAPTNTTTRHTLTLEAGDDISVNAQMNLGINHLTMIAGTATCAPCSNNTTAHDITINNPILTSGNVLLSAADNIFINDMVGGTITATQPTLLKVRAGNNITIDAVGNNGAIHANGAVSLTAADSSLTAGPAPLTVAPTTNAPITGIIRVHGNISTNGNDFTAITTATSATQGAGYFDSSTTGFSIDTGAGKVNIAANGSDRGNLSGVPIGALLGKIVADSLTVTTLNSRIVQEPATGSGNPALMLDIANTTTLNAGNNAIDLQNAANSLRGPIVLTTTGTGNNAILWNSAATTLLGATSVAGTLSVNATRDLAVTNASVTSAGDMTLTFGTQGGGSYAFCYLSGSACANASTLTGPTLTSTSGNLSVIGGTGANTFNLAGITLAAPTAGKSVLLDGTAGMDTVIGQNSQTTWDITAPYTGTLVNAPGTVNFKGMENLIGGSGDDTFTVSSGAPSPTLTLVNLDTGSGTDTVTVNANTTVSGVLTVGAGTNTVTLNGSVGSIAGTAGNGNNTINVAAGGAVVGDILTGSGTDVFNITGTVGGLIDGGAGSDTLALLTAGKTVKLGTAVFGNGYLNVDHVETINATGTGNTLLGHDNNTLTTTWNIDNANHGVVIYTSNSATSTTFSAFDNLTGGTGADTFTLGAAGSISGTINGGLGTGANTLVARQVANTWSFDTTPGSGSLTQVSQAQPYVNRFSNIQNYVGGGTNADWANFSANPGAVNVNAGSFIGFAGIIGNGTNSTLNGENGQTNNWSVQAIFDQNGIITDGLNDGVVNSNTPREVRFVNFNTLVGGNGINNFVISASGTFNGTINGGAGAGINTLTSKDVANNWNILPTNSTLSYSGVTTTFSNIRGLTGSSTFDDIVTVNSGATINSFDAGNGNNSITVNAGATVTGSIITGAGDDTINVSGSVASIDTGNGATNSVTVNLGGIVSGAITGGTGADTIIVNGTVGSISTAAGDDVIRIGATGIVNGVIDGGADTDTLDITALGNPTTVQIGNTPTANLGVYQVENINANANVVNTLVGDNGDNTWTVNAPNNGTVAGMSFTGFQNLVGGNGIDTFTINSTIGTINTGDGATNRVTVSALGRVTGAITGGAGADTIDVSGTVYSISTNAGNDVITVRQGGKVETDVSGGDGDDVFTVSGTVTGNLFGDAGDDVFTVSGGTVGGTIFGGTQTTALGDRVNLGANADVTLGPRIGLTGVSIDGIEGIVSTSGTLRARDGFNTTWDITGVDAGTANDNGGANLSFTGFNKLFGSDPTPAGVGGNDIFNVTAAGSISGQISAGNGTNILNVTVSAATPSGQVSYIGGAGSDTLFIDGVSNIVSFNSAINLNNNTYDRLSYTGTNNILNTFNVNYTSASVESVTDQVFASTLVVNGTTGNDSMALGNAAFSVNSPKAVNFINKTNLIVDGGLTSGGLLGNDTITLVGNFSTAANNLTLRNATTLNQATITPLTANELVLDNISILPATLNTTITSLSVTNAGAVSIKETDGLSLNRMDTMGPLTVVAGGDITDVATSRRTLSGALTLSTTGSILLNAPNQNYLSGPINLTAAVVDLNNNVATHFSGVKATALTVNAVGDITQSGAITVPGLARLTASGGSSNIILDNANNDFNTVSITAPGAVSLQDKNRIDAGTITANSVALTTTTGIGGPDVIGGPSLHFNTVTTRLDVKNTLDAPGNGVYITNNGAATVSITNIGNIELTNNGSLTIDRLYTNGGNFSDRTQYRDILLNVSGGGVQAYLGSPSYSGLSVHSVFASPDITANNLTVFIKNGGFGSQLRPISLSVFDKFSYFGGPGYVHYFGEIPPKQIIGAKDLVTFSAFDFLTSQQLLEVESLGEFDPAIFTAIRNYYYEDVAILMPADQRLDGPDENEDEKQKDKEEKL